MSGCGSGTGTIVVYMHSESRSPKGEGRTARLDPNTDSVRLDKSQYFINKTEIPRDAKAEQRTRKV